MEKLTIKWQRLVDENGETCPRCSATETEVRSAAGSLRASLAAMGIDVEFIEDTLDVSAFQEDPAESNRIWLAGKPLEAWLGAEVGLSPCCDTCGDAECRTVTVDGNTYEAIPARLIVRAGLLAAEKILGKSSSCCESGSVPPCCAPSEKGGKTAGCCPE